ncbi:MAG: hypothetical protein Kow00108_03630 [Calditrichia bacterium]
MSLKEKFKHLHPDKCSTPELRALWYDLHDQWDKAHRIIQEIASPEAAWIHAYLHRKEGDRWNAEYWYRRAGRVVFTGSPDDEWEELLAYFYDEENYENK